MKVLIKVTTLYFLLFCFSNLRSQVKQLISDDEVKGTYNVISDRAEDAPKFNVALGIAFVQVQYFNCPKFIIDLTASGYGGVILDYYHCLGTKRKGKVKMIFLGENVNTSGGKRVFNYTNDTVYTKVMNCLHGGVYYGSLIINSVGYSVNSPGFRLGFGRFGISNHNYKAKTRDFNLRSQKVVRRGFNIDAVYFPSFSYKDKPNNGAVVTTVDKGVLGALFCLHGSNGRCRDDRRIPVGTAWRLGAGFTANGKAFIDGGFGIAF